MIDLLELEKQIAEQLDEYRLAHTLSVKNECHNLAELFSLSQEDTFVLLQAALLHDCTKPLKFIDQLKLADEMGITLSDDDKCSPAVLHSITGAKVAKVRFNAPDMVVSAIACHTTGKEDMSIIDKLLFLADYIEPTRTFDDCIRVRRHFYEECARLPLLERLDSTLLLAFDLTIVQLLDENRPIHPQTVKSRNFLLKKP